MLRRHETTVEVDERMAPLIDALWALGIDTLGCCQNWSDVATDFGWDGKPCAYILFVDTPEAEAFIEGSPVGIERMPVKFEKTRELGVFFPPDLIPALTEYAEGLKA